MYRSPTFGMLTLEKVFEKIKEYVQKEPDADYQVMVGCDSQQHGNKLSVVSAIIVHKVGRGAIYFTERTELQKPEVSLGEKIYIETSSSIEVANALNEALFNDDILIEKIASAFS